MADVYQFVPMSHRYVELLLYILICINYVRWNFMENFDVFSKYVNYMPVIHSITE
jgi:hypothetical protein